MKDINIIRKFKVTYFAAIVGEPVTGSESISIPVSNDCKTRQFCANITLAKAGEPSKRGFSETTLRRMLGTPETKNLLNQYKFELRAGGTKKLITSGFLTKCIGGWWIVERWGAKSDTGRREDDFVRILGPALADSLAIGIFLYINGQCIGRIDNPLAEGKAVKVYDDFTGMHMWESNKRRGSSALLTYTGCEVLVHNIEKSLRGCH